LAPWRGAASAVAIEGMGLMSHEAAAVDPDTGDVYLTADNGPHSGFHRLRPHRRPRPVRALERAGLRPPHRGPAVGGRVVAHRRSPRGPRDAGVPRPRLPGDPGRGALGAVPAR